MIQLSNDNEILTKLFSAAQAHSEAVCDLAQVTNLQNLVKTMWNLMPPSLRVAVIHSEMLPVLARHADWDAAVLDELHRQDMVALDARMRDLGYLFEENEFGVCWESWSQMSVKHPTHEDARWAAYSHYFATRRATLLSKSGEALLDYLEREAEMWHKARTQPVSLREHLGMLNHEYSTYLKDPTALHDVLKNAR